MKVTQERWDVVVAGVDYYLRNRLPVRLRENLDGLLPVGANNFKVEPTVGRHDTMIDVNVHVTFDVGLAGHTLNLAVELDLRVLLTDDVLVGADLRLAAVGAVVVAVDAKLRQTVVRD